MNHKFNGATPCTPKKLAKQLLIESAKILSHTQRQALLDIFKTLDQAENNTQDNTPSDFESEQPLKLHQQNPYHQYHDELNQEFWSGQYFDIDTQEYPADWLRRTQQHPYRKPSSTAY